MAETLDIDMCLTSKISEGQKRWRNRVLCKLRLLRLREKT